jgi:hypothetical protein
MVIEMQAHTQTPKADQMIAELDSMTPRYLEAIALYNSSDARKTFKKFNQEGLTRAISERYKSTLRNILAKIAAQFEAYEYQIKTEFDLLVKDRTGLFNIPTLFTQNKLNADYKIDRVNSQQVSLSNGNLILSKKNFLSHFVVFTNIIDDTRVLNQSQPVLKIIKPEGANGDYIEKNYERPHYMPCNKTYINKISIRITDHTFRPVLFCSGPLLIKLHFQKIKNEFLRHASKQLITKRVSRK